MDRRSARWDEVSERLARATPSRLGVDAKLIQLLSFLVRRMAETGSPSTLQQIAREYAIDIRTISRWLADLRAAGLIFDRTTVPDGNAIADALDPIPAAMPTSGQNDREEDEADLSTTGMPTSPVRADTRRLPPRRPSATPLVAVGPSRPRQPDLPRIARGARPKACWQWLEALDPAHVLTEDTTTAVLLAWKHHGVRRGGGALEDDFRTWLSTGKVTAGALVEIFPSAAGGDNPLVYLRTVMARRTGPSEPEEHVDAAEPTTVVHLNERRRLVGDGA